MNIAKVESVREAREKNSACEILFPGKFKMFAHGYWVDKKGEMVHFHRGIVVEKLGNTWAMVKVDGILDHVKPDKDGWIDFELYL